MFCHKCGNQMVDDSAFCPKCGEKLIKDGTVSQSSIVSAGEPLPNDSAAEPTTTSGRFGNIALLGRVLSGISFLLLVLCGLFGLPINPVIILVGVALGIILSAFDLKRPLRINKIIELGVAGVLLVAGIVYAVSSGGGDEYIQMVKGGTLEAYPQMTVGEAFDNFLSNPEWESGVSDAGERFVNVHGGAFYADEEVELVVQFFINEVDETFAYNAWEMNGLPQNDFLFWGLLETVYSDSPVS